MVLLILAVYPAEVNNGKSHFAISHLPAFFWQAQSIRHSSGVRFFKCYNRSLSGSCALQSHLPPFSSGKPRRHRVSVSEHLYLGLVSISSQVSANAPVKCYSVILIFIETSLGGDAKRFISDAT